MTWEAFRAEYEIWADSHELPQEDRAGRTLFEATCKSWSDRLGFRKPSQHARPVHPFLRTPMALIFAITCSNERCTTCSKFTERIKTARGDDRQQVLKAQSEHLDMVLQWRAAQTRFNHLSEDALRPGRKDNAHELFKVDIDAADEAKFRVPRNTSSAKALEGLWRPQLHLHGALFWGVSCPILMCMWGFSVWVVVLLAPHCLRLPNVIGSWRVMSPKIRERKQPSLLTPWTLPWRS